MKPFLAAADWGTLVAILIFAVLSGLSGWLKKRRDDRARENPPPAPPRGAPPPAGQPAQSSQPTPSSWEEELRRLLEGEQPQAPPPPVVVHEQRAKPPPLPPPPVVARRAPPVPEIEEEDRGLAVDMPELVQSAEAHRRAAQLDSSVAERMRQRGALSEAGAAFRQASQLHAMAAERMRQVTEQTPRLMAAALKEKGTPEAARAVAMLRTRESIRSAILASIILGPPRALES